MAAAFGLATLLRVVMRPQQKRGRAVQDALHDPLRRDAVKQRPAALADLTFERKEAHLQPPAAVVRKLDATG